MLLEEAFAVVERSIEPRQLNKIQQLVFQYVWQGYSYSEIAKTTGYDYGYIKDTGSQLWHILSEAVGQKVTKKNCQGVLRVYSKEKPTLSASQTESSKSCQDWGEAVDTSIFYGRSPQLKTLDRWLVQDKCRMVAILGMGGVGKTTLSVKLAERVQGEFEFLFWRSLRDAPSLDEFLTSLLQFLDKEDSLLPSSESGKLLRLQERLQSSRCLLVLDNFDTLLAPSHQVGVYRNGYERYGELLRRIGEVRHQSCLVITSRDTPTEINLLQGECLPVRKLHLPGLEAIAACELLTVTGLEGSTDEMNHLSDRYRGNPLALKIVASSIQCLFAGKIADFLWHKVIVFDGIRSLIESQVDRLSPLERQVMYWLAIEREPVSVSELQSDLFPAPPTSVLLETLKSLKERVLLEQTTDGFSQQPVVMEYMTEQLLARICDELTQKQSFFFLNHYALLKATARDYIRASQIRVILEPLVERSIAALGSKEKLVFQLKELLARVRTDNRGINGYATGNLLNLFAYMEIDLTGFDLSRLSIWQANLANIKLQGVNFDRANLAKSLFAETFGGICCVAFSRDGKLLATSDTSGEVQIRELSSGQQLNTFKADLVWTWAVAFSPDDRLVATAGDDPAVKLWDVEMGKCLKILRGHTDTVNSIAFHPDGDILASSSVDKTVRLWHINNFEQNQQEVLEGHQGRVWSIAFSPDGSTLASASEDLTVKLWDLNTRRCLQTLNGHDRWVKTVAFSPDGQTIASASFDGIIKLWSVKTGACLQSWQGHKMTVTTVAFSPDNCWLASSSYDETVKIWDIFSGDCFRTLREHSNRVWSVSFSPDSQYLATGGDDRAARLWHFKTGQSIKTWKGNTNGILSLALSKERQILATGHEDQTIKLWSLDSGEISVRLRGHTNRVWSVVFAPQDETILASGSADRTIKIWNLQTRECLKTLYGHENWVWSVAFNPNGDRLASGSYDRTIRLWDIESGECLQILDLHTASVIAVIFSPDGRYLASGSFDSTIKLWEAETGKYLQTLQGHSNSVWEIAFSRDGKYLASGSYDKTVKLWDVGTGECLFTFEGHLAPIMSLAFTPNNQQLASGSFDRTIKFWDLKTGNCLRTCCGHTGLVSGLVFDSDRLISGSFDETIRFWNPQTAEEMGIFRTPRPYDRLNISGVTGLTQAQRATLKALGAIEND